MAVKMQDEFGDKLNTIFVESQGSTMDQVRKLALDKKWLGTDAMWTKERPVITGARGIPNFVLLSPAGEVVLMGNPISMHKEVEEYLENFKRGRVKPPADLPKELKSVYKNYVKGKLGAAITEAKKVEAKAQDNEVKAACADLLTEMTKVADAAVSRLERATAEGAYQFVKSRAKDLSKSLKGTEYEKKIAEQLKQLDDKALADEIKAEKNLARIERKLYSKGAAPAIKRQLEKFAEKHAGTKAAKRAQELAAAIG